MKPTLKINQDRLIQRLERLARIGELEGGGLSRLTFTEPDKQARDLLVAWLKELGLAVRIDRVGNILGIRAGESDHSPVMFGSHIDTVSAAGTLDGCFGVLAALECVQTLNELHQRTSRPLAVVAFTNEEGVRYAPAMLGSAVYVRKLSVEQALEIRGFDGSLFGDELRRIAYDGKLDPGAIRPFAYLELHIEQGPLLDASQLSIGVVDAVVGITGLEVTVTGTANHAGTTPTGMRHDAGLSAAKMLIHLREIAISLGEEQRVTCGMISFHPNAINVIPGEAIFTVDMRNPDGEALKRAEAMLREYAGKVEAEDGVQVDIRALEHVQPVKFHPMVIEAVEQAVNELGLKYQRMTSGAGHDAQLMSHICPTAMIFVPSRQGVSHSPQEFTPPEDLARGANVLLNAILNLAGLEDA
jgi:N-carbamoyl-L-amino-acid hydrolase